MGIMVDQPLEVVFCGPTLGITHGVTLLPSTCGALFIRVVNDRQLLELSEVICETPES